jgi:hypothetical protein
MLNCANLFRFQRSIPRVSNFQVNTNWEVIVEGHSVGELDSLDFRTICGAAQAAEPVAPG